MSLGPKYTINTNTSVENLYLGNNGNTLVINEFDFASKAHVYSFFNDDYNLIQQVDLQSNYRYSVVSSRTNKILLSTQTNSGNFDVFTINNSTSSLDNFGSSIPIRYADHKALLSPNGNTSLISYYSNNEIEVYKYENNEWELFFDEIVSTDTPSIGEKIHILTDNKVILSYTISNVDYITSFDYQFGKIVHKELIDISNQFQTLENGIIKNNSDKITQNESDISSNLSKITQNQTDISGNLAKTIQNETDIASNLGKINTNETNIANNLSKINTNETDIANNLSKINTNESDISSNLAKITQNQSDIAKNKININGLAGYVNTNITDISNNKTNISNNSSSITTINDKFSNTLNVNNLDFTGSLLKSGTKYLPYNGLDESGNDLVLDGNLTFGQADIYSIGTSTKPISNLYIGTGALYINGKSIIKDKELLDLSRELTIENTSDHSIKLQTLGAGDIKLQSTDANISLNASNNVSLTANRIDINSSLNIATGKTIQSADGVVDINGGVNITNKLDVGGEVVVQGNFTVKGTTSYIQTDVTELHEELLTLNAGDATLSSGSNAGIRIKRGSGVTPYLFAFEESTDTFRIGEEGNLQTVATREDNPTNNSIAFWNNTNHQFITDSALTYNQSTSELLLSNLSVSSQISATSIIENGQSLSDKYVSRSGSGDLNFDNGNLLVSNTNDAIVIVNSNNTGGSSSAKSVVSLKNNSNNYGSLFIDEKETVLENLVDTGSGGIRFNTGIGTTPNDGTTRMKIGTNGGVAIGGDYETTKTLDVSGDSVTRGNSIVKGNNNVVTKTNIDGSIVMFGRPNHYDFKGQVLVFEYNGSQFVQKGQELSGNDSIYDMKFGNNIDMTDDGLTIIVGTENRQLEADDNYVKVYSFNSGTNLWELKGSKLTSEQEKEDFRIRNHIKERYGETVSISSDGNRIIVGAPGYDDYDGFTDDLDPQPIVQTENRDLGKIYIYNYDSGSDSWSLDASFVGTRQQAYFGRNVILSPDGNLFIARSAYRDRYGYAGPGTVMIGNFSDTFVYKRSFDGTWSQTDNIYSLKYRLHSDSTLKFNSDGTRVIIGEPDYFGYGRVQVMNINDDGTLSTIKIIEGPLSNEFEFASSVAINKTGNIIAIGEPEYQESDNFSDTAKGKIYIYNEDSIGRWTLQDTIIGVNRLDRIGRDVHFDSTSDKLIYSYDRGVRSYNVNYLTVESLVDSVWSLEQNSEYELVLDSSSIVVRDFVINKNVNIVKDLSVNNIVSSDIIEDGTRLSLKYGTLSQQQTNTSEISSLDK